MYARPRSQAFLAITLLLLASILLAGCEPSQRLSARRDGDFSRGILVGRAAVGDEPALAVSPADGSLYAAWVGEGHALHLAHLGADGRLLASGALPLDAERAAQPTLLADPTGGVALLFLEGSPEGRLTLVGLSAEGAVAWTRPLGDPTTPVASYAAEVDAAGALHLVWAAGEAGGRALHYLRVGPGWATADPGADAAGGAIALGERGATPALRADGEGRLHLVWSDEPEQGVREIRYATLDAAMGSLGPTTVLASLPVPLGLVLRDPAVAVAGGDVYVYWALERRGGGLAPPSAQSSYVAFPVGRADEAGRPRQVVVPSPRDAALAPAESAYPITRLARVPENARPSGFVYYAAPAEAAGDELAVAMAVELSGRTQSQGQIVLTLWSGGAMDGYQVLAETPNTSIRPRLLADEARDLYVAWVDTAGFGAFDVFVAGTSGPMRAYLGRLRLQDIATAALNGLWGLVQVAGFVPITVAWLLPPLVVLAIYVLIHPEGDLTRRGPQVMLAVASILYMASKIAIRPGWLTDLPVPAWVAPVWADRLVLLAPLGIAAIAAGLTWLYLRRRDYPSLFPAFFIFAGSDILLTLLMYVPAVLSE